MNQTGREQLGGEFLRALADMAPALGAYEGGPFGVLAGNEVQKFLTWAADRLQRDGISLDQLVTGMTPVKPLDHSFRDATDERVRDLPEK